METSSIPLKLCMASQACTIESLIKENEEKKASINALNEQLTRLQDHQNQLQAFADDITKEKEQLINNNNNISAQSAQLSNQLKEAKEQTIPSLNNRIVALNTTITHLQEEKSNLQYQLDDMKGELEKLDDFKSNVEELRAESDRLQKQIANYDYDLNLTRHDNEQLHQDNVSLQATIDHLNHDKNQLSSNLADLTSQLEKATTSNQSLHQELLSHQTQLKQQNDHATQLDQQISQRDQTIQSLQSSLQQHQHYMEQAKQEYTQQKSELEKQLQTYQQKCSQFEYDLKQKEASLFALQKDISSQQQSTEAISTQIAQLQQENSYLHHQNDVIIQRAEFMITSIRDIMKASVQATPIKSRDDNLLRELTEEENMSIDSTIHHLQQWCHQLQNENQSLHQQYTDIQHQCNELNTHRIDPSELTSLQNTISSLQTSIAEKDHQIATLTDSLTSTESQLKETITAQTLASSSNQTRVTDLQQQLETLQSEASTKYRLLGEKYNNLVERYQLQQNADHDLTIAMNTVKEERNQLQTQLESLQNENKTIMEELNEKRQTIQSYEQSNLDYSQLRHHCDEVEQALNQSQLDVQSLTDQLSHLQSSLNEITAENAELINQLKQQQTTANEALQTQSTQHQQLEEYQLHIQQGQHDINTLQSQLADLHKQYEQVQQQYEQATQQAHQLEIELNQEKMVSKHYHDACDEKTNKDQLLQQAYQEIEQKNKEIETLHGNINELTTLQQSLQDQIKSYRNENEKFKSNEMIRDENVFTMKQENKQMKETIQRAINQIKSLYSSVTNQDRSVSLYQDSLAELTEEENMSIDSTIHHLQQWCHQLQNENQSLHQQYTDIQHQCNELNTHRIDPSELTSLQNTISSLQTSIAEKQHIISTLQQQLDATAVQTAKLTALQDELKSAQDALAEAQQRNLHADAIPSQSTVADASTLQQLIALQNKLATAQKELSDKRIEVNTLQAQTTTLNQRLQEAASTLQQLESAYDQLRSEPKVSAQEERLRQENTSLKMENQRVIQQYNQYLTMYNSISTQLSAKIAEVEQVRQSAMLKEQDYMRMNSAFQTNHFDVFTQQLQESIRSKDTLIADLQSQLHQSQYLLSQAKQETTITSSHLRQQLNDLQAKCTVYQKNADELTTVRSQLTNKQQEVVKLQQQLLSEINIVENLKSNYVEIDKILSNQPNLQSSSSLQAMIKAKEDHNQYLQSLINSLEATNRNLLAEKMALEAKVPQPQPPSSSSSPSSLSLVIQSIIKCIQPVFTNILITPESLLTYCQQLVKMLQDEKSLYTKIRNEMNLLQKEKAELIRKLTILQRYASGHTQIDKKADSFINDIIRERNDFEQKYNNAVYDLDMKTKENQQLKSALDNEKHNVIRLLEDKKEKEKEMSSMDISNLIKECTNICLLAKLNDKQKLATLPDMVITLKDVRRGIISTINLLKRENERLSYENKRIKEISAKDKKNEERVNTKIKEIIGVVQNQGKALKEFVIAFQAIQIK